MVKPVDASLHTKLKLLAERLAVRRAVQLTESALIQIPTVVGWLRPVILLPASALTGLNTEQLEAILAHELAHIKRYDYLVNMLQTIVETLGFYHPAVWWISHKIRAEREHCCDDLAVSISGDRVGSHSR
jgi:beta-lactamase regulating signal transducer with metallopeptidase domain